MDKLRNLDLNLLLPFAALYRTGSVKLAAQELHLSQSAFSHALARLRQTLDDELFVRSQNRMCPTAKAEKLAPQINQALAILGDGLAATEQFDPASSNREFRIAATDYTQLSLLPALLQRLRDEAPNIRIRIEHPGPDAFSRLKAREIDYLLGYSHNQASSDDILEYRWISDRYCLLAARNHPLLTAQPDLELYLELEHLVLNPFGEHTGIVDQTLKNLGHQRRVSLLTPNLLVAPFLIAGSEQVAAYPLRLAQRVGQLLPLQILELPFEMPEYQLQFYCHRLNAGESEFKWLTQRLLQAAEDQREK